MANDVQGGRVVIGATSDVAGFKDDLKSKIDAEVAGIRAQVRVGLQVQQESLRQQIDQAAAEAGRHTATVQTGADTSRLTEETRAAATQAGAEKVSLPVGLDPATDEKLKADIEAAKRKAQQGIDAIRLSAALRAGEAEKLEAIVRQMIAQSEAGATVKVHVSPREEDIATARATIDRLRAEAESKGIDLKVSVGGGGGGASDAGKAAEDAGSKLDRFAEKSRSTADSLSSFNGKIASAVTTVGGFAFSMGGAITAGAAFVPMLAQIGTLAGTLPGLLAAAGQGLLSLKAIFSGIGASVQELSQAQQTGGLTAAQNASAQISAAEAVASAQQGIADTQRQSREQNAQAALAVVQAERAQLDTQRQIADQQRSDAESVANAEYGLTSAVQQSTTAQNALNLARQQAILQLEQLNNQVTDSALAQQSASLSLAQAQQELANVQANPNATRLQREQASLAVAEAQQRLKEATQAKNNAKTAADQANQLGVQGNLQVVSAQQAVAASAHAVQQAEQALTDARHRQSEDTITQQEQLQNAVQAVRQAQQAQADTAITTSEAMQRASQSLSDALRAQQLQAMSAAGASASAMKAFDKLGPNAKALARDLANLMGPGGAITKLTGSIQEQGAVGIKQALDLVVGAYVPALTGVLGQTGAIIGNIAASVGKLLSSKSFVADMKGVFESNNTALQATQGGILAIVDSFRQLAVAAEPIIQEMARGFTKVMQAMDGALQRGRASGALTAAMQKGFDAFVLTAKIIGEALKIVGTLISDAFPASQSLGGSLLGTMQHFEAFLQSAKGRTEVTDLFNSIATAVRAVGTVIRDIGDALGRVAGSAGPGILTNLAGGLTSLAGPMGKFSGAEGAAFGKTLGVVADALNWILKLPGGATALAAIATSIGAILAAGQIAKVTGLSRIPGLISAITNSDSNLRGTTSRIGDLGKALLGIGGAEGEGRLKRIGSALKNLFTGGVGGDPCGDVKNKMQCVEDNVGQGQAKTAKAAETGAKDVEKAIVDGPAGAAEKAPGIMGKFSRVLTSALGKLTGPLKAASGGIGKALLGGVDEAGAKAPGLIGKFGGAMSSGVGGILSKLTPVLGEIGPLLSNPWVLGAVAIAALGFIVYECYKHFKGFRDVIDAIGRFFRDVFLMAVHAFTDGLKQLVGWVEKAAMFWAKWLNPIGLIIEAFRHFGDIKKIVGEVIDAIVGFFAGLPGRILKVLEGLGKDLLGLLAKAWQEVEHAIEGAVTGFVDVFIKFPLRILTALAHLEQDLGELLRKAWSWCFTKVKEGVDVVVKYVIALPGRFISGLENIGSMLGSLFTGALSKIWDAVTHGFDDVVHFFESIPDKILGALGDVGNMLFDAGRKILEGLGKGITSAVSSVTGPIGDALSAVKSFLPFSPAKVGPLAGPGAPENSGRSIAKLLGQGIEAGIPTLTESATRATSAVARALGGRTAPFAAGMAFSQGNLGMALVGSGSSTSDRGAGGGGGVTVAGDIVVNNPRQEPASTSVNTQLRGIQVLGTAAKRWYTIPAGRSA